MKTTWSNIEASEIKKDMFIIVRYWNYDAKIFHSLAKVTKTEDKICWIQEISLSNKNMTESEILKRFKSFSSTRRRKITENGKLISPGREIVKIFQVENTIIENIGNHAIDIIQNKIIELKTSISSYQGDKRATKKRLKSLGLI